MTDEHTGPADSSNLDEVLGRVHLDDISKGPVDDWMPADSDDLDDFLAGVHPDDIKQGSPEDVLKMVEKMKADMAEQHGDTWENLEKKHGFRIHIQARVQNIVRAGPAVSAEELERLITTPGSLSKAPFLGLATDFEYAPLPPGHFRLLTIRGLSDFPFAEMEAFPMDGAPEYTAMSYAWGKDTSSRAFFCNGRNFAVSGHVLDALNHLGLAWMDKKIWIDAICINQEDDAEKAVQVAEMRRIYYQAKQVTVWLGAEDDESNLVLDSMETFLEWGMTVHTYDLTPDQAEYRLLNPPPDSLCHALGRFLARPWFHRVWVVQEMLLAKAVILVCGNRFVNWDTFCSAVLLMEENGLAHLLAPVYGAPSPIVRVALANIGELHRLSGIGGKDLSAVDLIKLLKMGRFRKVTEPVDRVWGYLGLADEELRVAASPFINYSPERRLEYYMTYADIGKLLLQRDPELLLLSTVPSRPASRAPGMPSWCPDFHAAGLSGTSIQDARDGNLAFHSGYHEGEEGRPVVEFGPDRYTLKLVGFRLDRVDRVVTVNFRPVDSWEEERIQTATRDNLAEWDKQSLALARATILQRRGTHFLDTHWRTLSFDQMADQPQHVVRQAYLDFRDWANQNNRKYHSNLTVEARKLVGRFIGKVHYSCSRAYFSTAGRRVGLGPRNIAASDLVCIVHGAKVPYIFRSRPGRTEMEFVGDSYVDGVMYGESLKEVRQSEVFSID